MATKRRSTKSASATSQHQRLVSRVPLVMTGTSSVWCFDASASALRTLECLRLLRVLALEGLHLLRVLTL